MQRMNEARPRARGVSLAVERCWGVDAWVASAQLGRSAVARPSVQMLMISCVGERGHFPPDMGKRVKAAGVVKETIKQPIEISPNSTVSVDFALREKGGFDSQPQTQLHRLREGSPVAKRAGKLSDIIQAEAVGQPPCMPASDEKSQQVLAKALVATPM